MIEKILGFVCIGLGILTIAISGYNGYLVFTGSIKPIAAYETGKMIMPEAENLSESQDPEQSALARTIAPLLRSSISSAVDKSMEKPINITVHIVLLGFFASIGQKLAMIGTSLVRPIIVSGQSSETKTTVQNT